MATKPKPIKVCLINNGAARETPWAQDLGPAPGPKGSRKVRLINVPFFHAKPTWGDVIVVSPVDGVPTWDRGGASFDAIGSRIVEDGGRWAMIVDYAPRSSKGDVNGALAEACAELDIVCERAWAPDATRAGRAFLAVGNALTDAVVMSKLRAAKLPCELIQIHPKPAEKKPAKKKKRTR